MTIVFFCPKILRDYHKNLFQVERLKKEGYKAVFLDATKYYGQEAIATDSEILQNRIECATREDFIQFQKSLSEEPAVYVSFDQYLKFAAPIFELVLRKQDILLSYHTKRFSTINQPTSTLKKLVHRSIVELDNILPLHHCRFIYKRFFGYFTPDYFLCSTNYLLPSKAYLSVKRSNRIIVHADDINQIMEGNKQIIDKKKKVGVFLDQGLPFLNRTHPQIYKDPMPAGYLEEYYRKLEHTLKNLKEVLSLDEIVIALHPDAKKFQKELNGKFDGFRTFIGETKNLIRDANVVFGHCSTAVSFAIYFKKPVFVLKDQTVMNYHPRLREFMLFYLQDLGMTGIEMGEELPGNLKATFNEQKYSNYTKLFLKDNDIPENSYYYAINKIKADIMRP